MNNKMVYFLKTALAIWLSILIPLALCFMFMRSSVKSDVFRCIDTFIESENVNITKCLKLEFDNVYHNLKELKAYLENVDDGTSEQFIKNYAKQYTTVNYINVYDSNGKLLYGSEKNDHETQLDQSDLKIDNDAVNYSISENKDKKLSIVFFVPLNNKITKKKMFAKVSVDWNFFEKYIHNIPEGSFARMFYVISPDCKRYVSFNALPKKDNQTNAIALGMHLAEKIQSIINGLSNVNIASVDFRLVKTEIAVPEKMHGSKFFFVIATDNSVFASVSESLIGSVPFLAWIMVGVVMLISLIIARKHTSANEMLEVSNKISESTPLAIVIFNAETGSIKEINLAASTLLQIQPEEKSKINMWNMFVAIADQEYVKNAIDSDITVFNHEILAQTFGSGTFWSVCSASPVMIDGTKYIVLGILDINRRKEIEKKLANNAEILEKQISDRTADLEKNTAELQKINAELEASKIKADTANKAKSTFLTNVSNELKTPLNAILGYSEILKEEAEDRKDNVTADDLTKIIGSAHHLLSLINEILDLSQIESGKTQLFFENVSIENMLKEVESVVMPTITENNNSLYIEHSKDVGIMYTDATKLRQCLLNILGNSAKHTEFGKITLRASLIIKDGIDFVEFSVVDTGRGIAPDKLETIFEPFNDNDSELNLGLSVTKEYVEYLGGTINVESELGIGSKFVVRLPRKCETKSSEKIVVKNEIEKDDELIDL